MTNYLDMDDKKFASIIAEKTQDEVDMIFDEIDKSKDHTKVAALYSRAQTGIYWNLKDLDKVISLSDRAEKYAKDNGIEDTLFLSPIYYNMASFTLLWWSDSIRPNELQQYRGFQTSEKLLHLRIQNADDNHKLAGAEWMLAGHYLYTRRFPDKAIDHYEQGIQYASKSDHKIAKFMIAQCQEGIGRVHWSLSGDKEVAETYFTKAKVFYKQSDDNYSVEELAKFKEKKKME